MFIHFAQTSQKELEEREAQFRKLFAAQNSRIRLVFRMIKEMITVNTDLKKNA